MLKPCLLSVTRFMLLCVIIACAKETVSDNRDQCSADYSGIVCYPIDCCNKYVQCVNGVLYPPQVVMQFSYDDRMLLQEQTVRIEILFQQANARLLIVRLNYLIGVVVQVDGVDRREVMMIQMRVLVQIHLQISIVSILLIMESITIFM